MFSGKTEELIRRVRRAQYGNLSVVVFKPTIDKRYSEDCVDSHSGMQIRSILVDNSSQILSQAEDAQVIGVDEAQFFDGDLPRVCDQLANNGRRVICAGLDLDYRGRPFGPMPDLLCMAEYIQKMLAICVVCGNPADRSQRLVNREATVLVGEKDAYEARCRLHWDPENFDVDQPALPFGRNVADEATPPALR